ncbi:secondary thiamine-phosphate synthase enzyme YjbQ [Patescibacteria group bacterium]|nr:secondary thiamine-phosphate synthase enzyme YjbQ [Patescibacteria group bacterium]
MQQLLIKTTTEKQVVDITDQVNDLIKNIKEGWCYLFLTHTTAALSTADLDQGTDLDMLNAFREMIPKLNYRHPHNPEHMPDHILSSLIGTSLILPIKDNELILGNWQRVVLFEFSGPRERRIIITINESK